MDVNVGVDVWDEGTCTYVCGGGGVGGVLVRARGEEAQQNANRMQTECNCVKHIGAKVWKRWRGGTV